MMQFQIKRGPSHNLKKERKQASNMASIHKFTAFQKKKKKKQHINASYQQNPDL